MNNIIAIFVYKEKLVPVAILLSPEKKEKFQIFIVYFIVKTTLRVFLKC